MDDDVHRREGRADTDLARTMSEINLAMLEWQRQCFTKAEDAFRAGELLFMINVGRQAGKSRGLLVYIIASGTEGSPFQWVRGPLVGGHVGIGAPSSKHLEELKAETRRMLGESVSGPSPAGIGWDTVTGGRIDFWPLGPGTLAAARGRTYDIFLVDEAAHIPGLLELLEGNITPTLSTTGGPVISASTPDGVNTEYHDLWRRTAERARFSGGSALNPAITARYLAQKRRTMLELRYRQEHLAEFVDATGLKLRRSEVKYGRPPELSSFRTISMACDPAVSEKTSADYSGLAICGIDSTDRRWLLHLAHWRLSLGETEDKLLGFYHAWRPDVTIFEAVNFAAWGCRALLNAGMAVRPIVPHKDKLTRFERLHVRYHMGDIWHSDALDPECENELYAFDSGEHDDCVDATVYAFTPLFPELNTDWSGDRSSGQHWGNRLPHEIEAPRLYHQDGSYDVIKELGNGQAEMEHLNPDGTKFDDGDWHHEFVGDQCVIFEHGVEIGRYPRWVLPQLLANRQREYQEKYGGGRKVN